MLKRSFFSAWFRPQPCLKLFLAVMLLAPLFGALTQPALAEKATTAEVTPVITETLPVSTSMSADTEPEARNEPPAQLDPLDSPFPIPWNWITATYEDISSKSDSGVRYYRSQPLVSPDGQYAAYTRVMMQVQPEMHDSHVSSVMFVENLKTGKLQVISATSPLIANSLQALLNTQMRGIISVLMPVGWSKGGDRLLARQFEGLFNTSDASDSAVIWERDRNNTSTIAPSQDEYNHNIAVLLGWSETQPEQVLFRAGNLGDESWPLWAVKDDGTTIAATERDQPIVFGQQQSPTWAGPQVAYR